MERHLLAAGVSKRDNGASPHARGDAMTRPALRAVVALAFCALPVLAQDGIQRATVKKVDLEQMTITLTVGDKDQDFALTEKTQVLSSQAKTLKERLDGFK